MVDLVIETSIFEIGAEKREELFDDGLLVFAEPWAIVNEKIWTLLLLKAFCEDMEE